MNAVLASAMILYAASAAASVTMAQAESRTIWDGVFTGEQAKRGRVRYEASCGYCHQDDLRGGGGDEPGASPPPLKGSDFLASWKDSTLAELVGTVAATMPFERPKLEPQAYVDIVSYLLQANGTPAGSVELPNDVGALRQIAIVVKPAP